MKQLTIVRGYPGSGRTTLAHEIGRDGLVLSAEEFFAQVPPGEDVYTSLEQAHAFVALLENVQAALQKGRNRIVADFPGQRLWELRDIMRLGERAGYDVDVQEPATPWAKDPSECAKLTNFPLKESTWRSLVQNWEELGDREAIMNSFSPDERIRQARHLVSLEEGVSGLPAPEVHRFVMDNFPFETEGMVNSGFWGRDPNDPKKMAEMLANWRQFRQEMERQGRRPPELVPFPLPQLSTELDQLGKALSEPNANRDIE